MLYKCVRFSALFIVLMILSAVCQYIGRSTSSRTDVSTALSDSTTVSHVFSNTAFSEGGKVIEKVNESFSEFKSDDRGKVG